MYPLLVAAVATGVGIATGWSLGAYVRDDRAGGPASEEWGAVEVPEGVRAVSPEHDDFEEVPIDFSAMLESIEARGMRVVPRRVLRNWDEPVIGRDGRISERLSSALLLSEEEIERMNHAFRRTADRLEEIELEHLRIVHAANGRVVFHIGAYERQGEILRRALQRRIFSELGERDGSFLWDLVGRAETSSEKDYWGGFGRDETMVVFEKAVIEQLDGTERVEFSFTYGPVESGGASAEGGNRVQFRTLTIPPGDGKPRLATLAGRHDFLFRFFPDEMRQYFDPEP